MFKSKISGMTVVHDDRLFFVSHDGSSIGVDHEVSLDVFLADDFALTSLPITIRNRPNRLLIVPDYWFGQTSLTLQSQKRSVVEPFVERNLLSEHPDLPEIGLFYGYVFLTDPSENGNISTFFLQEPKCYRLYQKLDAFDMTPFDLTIPAYVWEKKLSTMHPDAMTSGVGLIHKLASASYLYFYHKGQFLFSRSIQSSDVSGEDADVLNALTYEINQSVYHFSQKKKADLSHIFIHSSRAEDAAALAESLGKEVRALDEGEAGMISSPEAAPQLGPCSIFSPKDLAPSRKYQAIAQKDHAKTREWRPVQLVGAIVGILLFLILGIEHFFLIEWLQREKNPDIAGVMTGQSSSEIIAQYNESLDLILDEGRGPSAWKTTVDLARCLPKNIRIKQMKLAMTEMPAVKISCVVRAQDMADFKHSLSMLLENIGDIFPGSPKLEKRDIELGEILHVQDHMEYPIQLELRL